MTEILILRLSGECGRLCNFLWFVFVLLGKVSFSEMYDLWTNGSPC